MCECVCVLAKEGDGDEEEEKKGQEQGPICQRNAQNPSHSTPSPRGRERETTHLWQFFFCEEWGCPTLIKTAPTEGAGTF